MRTIPCKLLAGDDLELITKRQADRNWMKQACSGDPTDNYKGIPGVGLVGADKILGDSIKARGYVGEGSRSIQEAEVNLC